MEIPVKVAPCQILHAANGGRFNSLGKPILEDGVRSLCDRAFDCKSCPYMMQFMEEKVEIDGYSAGWECIQCLKDQGTKMLSRTEKNGIERVLLGFFQAGRKKYSPNHPDFDSDYPVLDGCTRCGWESSFLQLVLRKI